MVPYFDRIWQACTVLEALSSALRFGDFIAFSIQPYVTCQYPKAFAMDLHPVLIKHSLNLFHRPCSLVWRLALKHKDGEQRENVLITLYLLSAQTTPVTAAV